MRIPKNRFALFAVLWFVAAVYLLLFSESDGGAPPFVHFDKVVHFALFFAQFWLLAKAFMQDGLAVPYRLLFVLAVLAATGSETAQALFTRTREGSIADSIADMFGAGAALWLAYKVASAKRVFGRAS
ncbi:VanZ family protein [Neisseria sp.]|uniref:VanZ family protein n=1 Tax=Neisseria sp. TaxID=192066 RepID=UPI0026DC3D37|nr:VanZ family protein [Neisseria sp.]MDO4906341.1 VanZ family protein [Neisseria sp.]